MSVPTATVPDMVKLNVEAVGQMLQSAMGSGRRYSGAMPTFTLSGIRYEFAAPEIEGAPEQIQSWDYGHWPKVEAAVPLTDGGSVSVSGEASRWGHGHIAVSWMDDELHTYWAWIPAANVRRLTPSEADIIEYHQCPPDRRSIRWAKRLPGFLPY